LLAGVVASPAKKKPTLRMPEKNELLFELRSGIFESMREF